MKVQQVNINENKTSLSYNDYKETATIAKTFLRQSVSKEQDWFYYM